jgi:prepilin-type N-terminal cleavage/methylation domain-containing protein
MSSTARSRIVAAAAFVHRHVAGQDGFTLIEVMVAAVVMTAGLLALLGALDVASHANHTNRVRQEGTSVAREVVEDVRGLPYTQLATPASIASGVQPLLTGGPAPDGATLNGSTITVNRSIYSYTVSFTTCSLDDPSDGYGNHNQAPPSGGNWCPDVAASGTADSAADDYKRVSVTVTPNGAHAMPVVQQTVLVYNRPTHGPAVSCVQPSTSTSCGASPPVTDPTVTSIVFSVTTTAPAASVQWLVNGNPPPAGQIAAGALDPYTPSGTTSQFTWVPPTPDGMYSISVVAFDGNGNSGTRSTIQIQMNRHAVIPPGSLRAGFDPLISGVDLQWVPSIDQDVRYYRVYRSTGGGAATVVCDHVTGTSCTDMTAPAPAAPPAVCNNPPQSYTTSDVYWVDGVDLDANGALRENTTQTSPQVDANLCDHAPAAPAGLTGTLNNGVMTLNWSVPASPVDPDSGDSILQWRIYRWAAGQSAQFPGSRWQLVGALNASGNYATSASDDTPDPGGVTQNYCVTSVDTRLQESPCSNTFSG